MKTTSLKTLVFMLFCGVSASAAIAQQSFPAGSIYMCNLSSERVLSSDRPIPECAEKEQRVMGSNGLAIGILPPASEGRAREQRRVQQEEEEKRRATNEARKGHLLLRYPDAATHDAKRQFDLAPLYEKLKATNQQIELLLKQLADLDDAASKPDAAPLNKEKEAHIQSSLSVQQHIASTLRKQIAAINSIYDEEKAFLSEYWKKN
ncbi:MAG: hypothetical protein ACRCWR_00680 [Saezia sp.]